MNKFCLLFALVVAVVHAGDDSFSIGLGVLSPSYSQTVGKENVKVNFEQKDNGFSYSVGDPKSGTHTFSTFGNAAAGQSANPAGYANANPTAYSSGYAGATDSGYGASAGYAGPAPSAGYAGPSPSAGYAGPSPSAGYAGPSPSAGYSGPSPSAYNGAASSGYAAPQSGLYSGFAGYQAPSYGSNAGLGGASGYGSESGFGGASGYGSQSGFGGASGYGSPSGFGGSSGAYGQGASIGGYQGESARKPENAPAQILPAGFSYHGTDGQAFLRQGESPNFVISDERQESSRGPAEQSFHSGLKENAGSGKVLVNGLVGYGPGGRRGSLPVGGYAGPEFAGLVKEHGGHSA